MAGPLRLPNDTERHAIVGSTGSGKTTFGLWCLAQRRFDQMPWVIIDFKHDDMIADIPRLDEFDVDGRVPRSKGLYVVRPTPDDIDQGRVSGLLMRIWENEKTGIFIDEGYMIRPMDQGLRTVLTQGRSKRIPVISLSQRPAHISPWLLSESEFKSVFFLEHPRDIERMNEWMPRNDPSRLADHHSYWYQRDGRKFATFSRCPGREEILDMFDARRVRRWVI